LILRCLASRFTSCITGRAPPPEASALPGCPLLYRQRSVSEVVAELFGWLLLTFADPPAVNYHVALILGPVPLRNCGVAV
jgi:hypothetical protein